MYLIYVNNCNRSGEGADLLDFLRHINHRKNKAIVEIEDKGVS